MFVNVAIEYYFVKMFSHFTLTTMIYHIVGPVTTCETLVDQHSQWPHIPCQSQIENTPGETRVYLHMLQELFMIKIHLCLTKLVQMVYTFQPYPKRK